MSSKELPVLIVGAGPTGLTIALELARRHIPFRIIDKSTKPVPTSNALVAQTRTLEIWDKMGLIDDALSRGSIIRHITLSDYQKKLVSIDFDILESKYPFVLGISQHETESMLLAHLNKMGIDVEMNMEFDGNLNAAKWIIACDGGRSAVRTQLNIPFLGKELPQHFVMADIDTSENIDTVRMFVSPFGPLGFIPYGKNKMRILAEVTNDKELHEAKTLTNEQIYRLIKERTPVEIDIGEPFWTTGFWIHERLISTYRHNNVFFAGDAAHLHSPAGGQGMNTGIQDAYNLAWKLAKVIKREAPEALLDRYQAERYPVAKDVLKTTTLMTVLISLKNPLLQKMRNFLISLFMKSSKIRKAFAMKMTELNINEKGETP